MALEYPYPAHPEPGTTIEVADGVRWLTMPMGGSLNHINLYLLEDADGWFVVDTGLATEETKRLWHEIFETELGGKPVKGVICTHMHPDHVGQAGMIVNHYRCPLYMTRAEYYQARSFLTMGLTTAKGGWLGEQFYHRYGMSMAPMHSMRDAWKSRAKTMGRTPTVDAPDPLPMGYHRLQDGDLLTIGDHDWQVVVGAGHSPEHACLHCHSLGIMISGDQILPVITSNVSVHPTEPEANPLKVWMESHDKFLDTPENTFVLPAHNLPFYGIRERLRDLIGHHEDRMLAIEEFCEEPKTAKELLPVLFRRKLDARQTMMALGEAIAHCHLLMHRNRLKRTLEEDGRYRFRSIDPDMASGGTPARRAMATIRHPGSSRVGAYCRGQENRRAHPGRQDEPDEAPMMV